MQFKSDKKKHRPIVVMLSYARTGGTMLNRCLASLPGVFMLSEVNIEAICPSSLNTIAEQAEKWYGLKLKSTEFMEQIREIYEYCEANDLTLVVRDWTFGSFVPSRYNKFKPSKTLATYHALKKEFPVVAFGLVRDAVDIWLSLKASPRTFYDTKLEYLHELTARLLADNIKHYKYEDLCQRPVETMKNICSYAGLTYDNVFRDYARYDKVTGDVDLPGHSRGIQKGDIGILPRRQTFNEFVDEIRTNTKANIINQMLDYDRI